MSALLLSASADSKYGLAFTLGGVVALARAGLLRRVRCFQAVGYAHVLWSQLLLAVHKRLITRVDKLDNCPSIEWLGCWEDLSQCLFQKAWLNHVLQPLKRWCLMNHEWFIFRQQRRMWCQWWRWQQPWAYHLAELMDEAGMDSDDLLTWARAIHMASQVQQKAAEHTPVFSWHAATKQGHQVLCLTTMAAPPNCEHLNVKFCVVENTDVHGFLSAGICFTEEDGYSHIRCALATVEVTTAVEVLGPAYDIDALSIQTADLWFMKFRMGQSWGSQPWSTSVSRETDKSLKHTAAVTSEEYEVKVEQQSHTRLVVGDVEEVSSISFNKPTEPRADIDCDRWLILNAITYSPRVKTAAANYHARVQHAEILSSRDGAAERPNCYRRGMVMMYASPEQRSSHSEASIVDTDDARTPLRARVAQKADSALAGVEAQLWCYCVNWGYWETLRTYAQSECQPEWLTPPCPEVPDSYGICQELFPALTRSVTVRTEVMTDE